MDKAIASKWRVSDGIQVKVKSNFAIHHFFTSVYFLRQVKKIEESNTILDPSQDIQYRSYVCGSILSTLAGFESAINELYTDAADQNPHNLKGLKQQTVERLARLWKTVERLPTLEKYEIVLIEAEKTTFQGTHLRSNAEYAQDLRNALMHYKPEWDNEQKIGKRFEKQYNKKFKLNPYASKSQAFFPHRCLSYDCAKWVFTSIINYLDEFYSELDIRNILSPHKENELKIT
jgi:hypothetical protein